MRVHSATKELGQKQVLGSGFPGKGGRSIPSERGKDGAFSEDKRAEIHVVVVAQAGQ